MSDPDDDLDLTRQHFAEVRTGSVPNCARTVPIGNTSEQTCSPFSSEHFGHTSDEGLVLRRLSHSEPQLSAYYGS